MAGFEKQDTDRDLIVFPTIITGKVTGSQGNCDRHVG